MPDTKQQSDLTKTPSGVRATLLLSSQCPHCPTVLNGLIPLIKSGELSELHIINLSEQPEAADLYSAQTVPWTRFSFALGHFDLEGRYSEPELQQWCRHSKTIKGISLFCLMLLEQGKIQNLEKYLIQYPDWMHAVLLLVEDPDTSLTIRIGISAILESLHAEQFIPIFDALIMMTQNTLARIRSDACFYLSLTRNTKAIAILKKCTSDENKDVREIAQDSITDLEQLLNTK